MRYYTDNFGRMFVDRGFGQLEPMGVVSVAPLMRATTEAVEVPGQPSPIPAPGPTIPPQVQQFAAAQASKVMDKIQNDQSFIACYKSCAASVGIFEGMDPRMVTPAQTAAFKLCLCRSCRASMGDDMFNCVCNNKCLPAGLSSLAVSLPGNTPSGF